MSRRKRTASTGARDAGGRAARQAWAPAVRQRVVHAVVEQGLPVDRVARAVGVPGTTAAEWVRKYRRGGLGALTASRRGPAPRPARSDPRREAGRALREAHLEFGVGRLRDLGRRWATLAVSATAVRRGLGAGPARPLQG